MRTQLLAALKEADDYISGQELCEHFGVSRTAIWKAVKQLKEAGYVIEACLLYTSPSPRDCS